MADGKKLFDFYELSRHKDGRFLTRTHYVDDFTTIKGLAARGTLESDAAWILVQELIIGGVVIDVDYADNANFTQIWDDRLTVFPATGTDGARNLFMQPIRLHDEDGKPFTSINPVPITLTGGSAAAGGQDGPAKVLPVTLTANSGSPVNLSTAMISTGQTTFNAINIQNRSGVNIEINYVSTWTTGDGWTVDNGTDFFHDITEGPIAIFGRSLTATTALVKLLAIDNSA